MASDFSGLIPSEFGRQILQEATVQSAVLRLATTQRMGTHQLTIPVLSALPRASFITGVGAPKPVAEVKWTSMLIQAEEVAAILPVPTAYVADAAFPLWAEIRPLLAQAIAVAVDDAVLAGDGAPASFPPGGVLGFAGAPIAGPDVINSISEAMSVVENSGLDVNGVAARNSLKGALRAARTTTGEYLLVAPTDNTGAITSVYGEPISYTRTGWGDSDAAAIVGDWTKLVLGLREDMRFDVSTDATLHDGAGKILVSAFQDDVAIMRVYMRLGAVIGEPVTLEGTGAPFAAVEAPGVGSQSLSVSASKKA